MNKDIKNFFLAGLGSAAYTYEKATTLIDDFVQKGKLTLEEGKDLSEELKRNIKGKTDSINPFTKEKGSMTKDITPLTKEDIVSILSDMDFATKKDVENINKRLSNLEKNHL
ncbi:phasin family protein [Clostridium algoriphilum]|uniref:phasin family protein n=1 Tax=Clostridium algoriphilum TaxID=198347 RepID=UPI001CF148B1|nr:phasin family protein [Clostridium algoriphilum]MCB2295541.1 phasin family protein [Clostridium algoriphilum]